MIELVVVIVILGILAVTALPKFVDLSADAGKAATQGVAGAIASATAINYGAKAAGHGGAAILNGTNAATCSSGTLQPLLSGITLVDANGPAADASTYNVDFGAGTCLNRAGLAISCTLEGSKGGPLQATVICTGP